jgi:hypothetical protein
MFKYDTLFFCLIHVYFHESLCETDWDASEEDLSAFDEQGIKIDVVTSY